MRPRSAPRLVFAIAGPTVPSALSSTRRNSPPVRSRSRFSHEHDMGLVMLRRLLLALCALLTGGFVHAEPVVYDWFEYTGHDAVFEQAMSGGGATKPPPHTRFLLPHSPACPQTA